MSAPLPLAGTRPEAVRRVATPEGVELFFELAEVGGRVAAFFFDVLAVVGISLAILLPALIASARFSLGPGWVVALAILVLFLVRTFYFTWFELRWRGATPGKRRMGLRVIDRRGGPISAEAIVARNLTREVEVFLPVAALSSPQLVWPGAPGWAALLALAWLAVLALLPVFNRDHLRVGDLVAGTMVVRAPAVRLLQDLVARAGPAVAPRFSPEQLEVYGIYELQVLEDLLRDAGRPDRLKALTAVADTVRRKIGWEGPVADPEGFLRAFYAAQRRRLEHQLLFGRRRADKHQRG